MNDPCPYDPTPDLQLGMFHCPECGEMVVGGLAHPRYWEADRQEEESMEMEKLEVELDQAVEEGRIGLADQSVIREHEGIIEEIWEALELNAALITDQSCLRHFGLDEDETIQKLEEVFGLDLTDQYDWDFADLLPYIDANRQK